MSDKAKEIEQLKAKTKAELVGIIITERAQRSKDSEEVHLNAIKQQDRYTKMMEKSEKRTRFLRLVRDGLRNIADLINHELNIPAAGMGGLGDKLPMAALLGLGGLAAWLVNWSQNPPVL